VSVSVIGGEIYWNGTRLPAEANARLINGRLWAECLTCGQTIRLNKPLLGSLHFCVEDKP